MTATKRVWRGRYSNHSVRSMTVTAGTSSMASYSDEADILAFLWGSSFSAKNMAACSGLFPETRSGYRASFRPIMIIALHLHLYRRGFVAIKRKPVFFQY